MHNIDLKGWNSQAHKVFPGKVESSNLSRDSFSREIKQCCACRLEPCWQSKSSKRPRTMIEAMAALMNTPNDANTATTTTTTNNNNNNDIHTHTNTKHNTWAYAEAQPLPERDQYAARSAEVETPRRF